MMPSSYIHFQCMCDICLQTRGFSLNDPAIQNPILQCKLLQIFLPRPETACSLHRDTHWHVLINNLRNMEASPSFLEILHPPALLVIVCLFPENKLQGEERLKRRHQTIISNLATWRVIKACFLPLVPTKSSNMRLVSESSGWTGS